MELLDSDDTKNNLLRKSAQHREQLEGGVKDITESTEKVITNALIIGGSLALTYFLMRKMSGGGSGKKHKSKQKKIRLVQEHAPEEITIEDAPASPGIIGEIGAAIASQASVFLLNLAKEKLMEIIQAQFEKKEQQ